VVIMKLFMNHYEGSRCIPLCRIIPAHLTNCVNTREPRPLLYVNNRSVCLILELCSFGSLSDIIRGYGFDWNSSHRQPLKLSYADVIYLALGCAR
jgi:hypothetical protein